MFKQLETSNKTKQTKTTSLQPGWDKLLITRQDGHAEIASLLREATSLVQSRGWLWISGTDKDATKTCAVLSLNGCCENKTSCFHNSPFKRLQAVYISKYDVLYLNIDLLSKLCVLTILHTVLFLLWLDLCKCWNLTPKTTHLRFSFGPSDAWAAGLCTQRKNFSVVQWLISAVPYYK